MASGKKVVGLLLKQHPNPKIALSFSNALELLIATILSAQCTDARVNEVTKALFKRFKNARDYAEANSETFEQEIRPTGFYKSKANLIMSCCKILVRDFNGTVPSSIEALTTLPGVGRKTANIVLGNAFGQQAIAVDTHVLRVSNRLGLAHSKNADKVEKALMQQVPRDKWTLLSNAMILHGRGICTARKPRCGECKLYQECEWREKPQC